MPNIDSLKETVSDLAHAGVAKAKQVAEISRLKASNMAEEDTIKKAYVELGKLYYAERGDSPEAAYIAGCQKITDAKANIEANNARIAELKEKTGEKDEDDEPADEVQAEEAEEPAAEEAAPAEEPAQPEQPDGESN